MPFSPNLLSQRLPDAIVERPVVTVPSALLELDGVTPLFTGVWGRQWEGRVSSLGAIRNGNVLEPLNTTPAATHRRYPIKRPIETVLAAFLLLLTLPVTLVVAGISAIKYRSRPFFVQQRIGLHGKRFGVIKIRSLPATTAPYADRDELDQTEISGYGSFIRSTHLDELPQLWQVVTGTMGLVGPRPMIESIVDRMDPDHGAARHTMRPGVTGLWQVSEYGSRLVLEASEYDAYYVTTANLRLDAWILWATAKQTFGAEPVRSEQFPSWIALPEPALREFHGPHAATDATIVPIVVDG